MNADDCRSSWSVIVYRISCGSSVTRDPHLAVLEQGRPSAELHVEAVGRAVGILVVVEHVEVSRQAPLLEVYRAQTVVARDRSLERHVLIDRDLQHGGRRRSARVA